MRVSGRLRLPMPVRLPWPAPALLAWGGAWAALRAGAWLGWPPALSLAGAAAIGALLTLPLQSRWRQLLVAAGLPMSWWLAGGGATWPAWTWLTLLLPLLLLYPMRAWGDAPFFPTPVDALDGLADRLSLPQAPHMLDAGCGAGHGLAALRRTWPAARVEGIEWSWPLALAACARLRGGASVRRGDLWADDWSGYDLVYLFQRPESMPRAWAKACAEMRPGSWLVSLEFGLPDLVPDVTHAAGPGRAVHAWRIGAPRPAQPRAAGADNPRRPAARRKSRPQDPKG